MTTPARTIVRVVVCAAATLAAVPARADLPVSCTNFTDSPLVAGTLIKAVHLTQLRTCVNALRAERALSPATWTDATIVTQVTVVKAVHITELRTALGEAYVATGYTAPAFGAAPVAGQTVIAASFFTDIRVAIGATPDPCVVSLSPSSVSLGQAGGSASVALQAPCPWTASSSAAWLTPVVTSGNGSQTLAFTYEANPGLERHATITVNGISFTVTQPGAGDPVALLNADFEDGFAPVSLDNPSPLATGWSLQGDANLAVIDRAGVPGDYAQHVEDGWLFQNITVVPDTTYVVTADVQVDGSPGSAVKLYMHMAGGVHEQWALSTGGGASRMRLVYHTPATPTGDGNARIGFYDVSGTFTVDHVQVVPLSWGAANERVTNGEFEAGFVPINDWQSHGLLADDWERVGVSSSAVVFSFEESNTGLRHTIEHANAGDGIGQVVSVIPEQPYLLRAIVSGPFRAARVGIGPVGALATHTVLWCDAGGLPQTLWLLYTPPAGQTAVSVSVTGARDDASFAVDSVSLMPTTLTSVDPGAAQGGCVQRHTLTFEVRDAMTQDPVDDALITIPPTWGTGPARTTYSDGTLSYLVGEGPLQFSVSKSGYQPSSGTIQVSGGMTWAVSLSQGSAGCGLTISPGAIVVASAGGETQFNVSAPIGCSWTATINAPFASITNPTGSGSAVVGLQVQQNSASTGRQAEVSVEGQLLVIQQLGDGETDWVGDGSGGTFYGSGNAHDTTGIATLASVAAIGEDTFVNLNSKVNWTIGVWNQNYTALLQNIGLEITLAPDAGATGHIHAGTMPQLATVTPSTCNTGVLATGCQVTITTHATIASKIQVLVKITNGPAAGTPLPPIPERIVSGYLRGADLSPLQASPNWKPVGRTPTHPANHFGQAGFLYNLGLLHLLYAAQFPELDVLCQNDIALTKGGMFDHTANWRSPHAEHRQGLNADIRARPGTGQNDTVPCNGMPRDAVVRQWFEDALFVVFGHRLHLLEDEGNDNEHYHIRDRAACKAPAGSRTCP